MEMLCFLMLGYIGLMLLISFVQVSITKSKPKHKLSAEEIIKCNGYVPSYYYEIYPELDPKNIKKRAKSKNR